MAGQRETVGVLRDLIDRARLAEPGDNRPGTALFQAITADPSVWSTHVQHNIGRKRADWLADFARERGVLPVRDETLVRRRD